MNNGNFKKFECKKNNIYYVIEEDLVGWYLIVYNDENKNESSKDYLFDTLEDAIFEAEDKFSIPKNSWKEFLGKSKTNR